jgi:hypothetical protein
MGNKRMGTEQSVDVDVVSRRIGRQFGHPGDRRIPIEEFI